MKPDRDLLEAIRIAVALREVSPDYKGAIVVIKGVFEQAGIDWREPIPKEP